MNVGTIKNYGKRVALTLGLYRPARFVSDLLTNPVGRKKIKEDTEFYSKMLRPGSLCFDVGGNIGAKSYAMLSTGARVVTFEPIPYCVAEIKQRCSRFEDRLTVCQVGLGREPGRAVLHTSTDHDNYSSFHNDWEGDLSGSLEVEVSTLDAAISEFGKPDYCKIDVEGWEFEVLSGLSEMIPLVSFEYHLAPRELEATLNCIDHLSRLTTRGIELNVARAETTELYFDDWLPKDEFLKKFPADFKEMPGFSSYGDIWVRET